MNDTAQHVDQLISAYVEGQLSRDEMMQVGNHIARCDRCREIFARHEQLAEDLRLTMKHFPPVRSEQVEGMWQAIRQQRQPIRMRAITPRLIPLMASLALILGILIAPLFSIQPVAAASTSAALPEVNPPFIPTGVAEAVTAESIATPQPVPQQPVTPALVFSPPYPLQAVPPTAENH
jgi:anti-sigma factor RsiW